MAVSHGPLIAQLSAVTDIAVLSISAAGARLKNSIMVKDPRLRVVVVRSMDGYLLYGRKIAHLHFIQTNQT